MFCYCFYFFCCWFCYCEKLYFSYENALLLLAFILRVCVCLTHFNGFTTYTLAFMSAVMYASSNIPSISIFSMHVRIRFTVFALCFVLCCVSLLSLSSSSSSLFAPSLLSMLCFIAQHTVCFCFQLFPSLKWLLVERTLRSESVLSKQSAVGNQ